MQRVEITHPQLIDRVVAVLNAGGIVIYPTETCYGIGVDATNPGAVEKLFKYKDRVVGKAVSIAVSSPQMAAEYVKINDEAAKLYERFTPGPITIISHSLHNAVSKLESEQGTLGVRIPDYPVLLEIIAKFGKPITTTGANLPSKGLIYSPADLEKQLPSAKLELVDLLIDAGRLPPNPPSTVADTTLEDVVVYRPGAIKYTKPTLHRITQTAEETTQVGTETMQLFKDQLSSKALVVMMHGSMGAGKTYFTKGVGKSLGIAAEIKSPSYTYVLEYDLSPYKLIHIDAWRINNATDLQMIIMPEWFVAGNVIVIEWASKAMSEVQKYLQTSPQSVVINVEIQYGQNQTERIINVYTA